MIVLRRCSQLDARPKQLKMKTRATLATKRPYPIRHKIKEKQKCLQIASKTLWTTCLIKRIGIDYFHICKTHQIVNFYIEHNYINHQTQSKMLINNSLTANIIKLYGFCTESKIRSFAYYPMYLSPNYDQLEYSSYYVSAFVIIV